MGPDKNPPSSGVSGWSFGKLVGVAAGTVGAGAGCLAASMISTAAVSGGLSITAAGLRQEQPSQGLNETPSSPGLDTNTQPSTQGGWSTKKKIACVAAGAVGAVVVAPVVVSAVGFGAGGIKAGSLAASMMSKAATSGVGMRAVSTLQSVGAAGFGAAGKLILAAGGATVGGAAASFYEKENNSNQEGEDQKSKGDQEQKSAPVPHKKHSKKNKKIDVVDDDTDEDSEDEFCQQSALNKRL